MERYTVNGDMIVTATSTRYYSKHKVINIISLNN